MIIKKTENDSVDEVKNMRPCKILDWFLLTQTLNN